MIHELWIWTVGFRIIGSDLTIVLVRIPDVLLSRQHGVHRTRNIDHRQKNLWEEKKKTIHNKKIE